MNKIIDFRCRYNDEVGVSKEIIEATGLKFPEAYKKWDTMVKLSLALKENNNSPFCFLPFCHTVEGEALGGIINLGDENIGPRAKEYICKSPEEILDLPEIDYSKGRISEVLKACKYLREKGEEVVLYISGPFTILNMLIDPKYVFKAFRKNPELIKEILLKLQKEIVSFVSEAQKVGVNIISYSDPTGGVNIIGPKLAEQLVEMFTYPLLKEIERTFTNNELILLCPKTTFALLGTEKAVWEDIHLESNIGYSEAVLKVKGQAKFCGQMCIKNKDFKLKNGIFKAVKLL